MKSKFTVLIALIIGLIIGGAAIYVTIGPLSTGSKPGVEQGKGEEKKGKKILYWRAPMDPTYISDKPGKSPMGMDLIPVYEGEEDLVEPGTVKIDPVTIQNIGVRTETATRRTLKKTVRTIGRIDYNEETLYYIHTKIDGWIEKLYVDFTGEEVKKDDILLEIYSPILLSAQEEYLLSRRYATRLTQVGRESIIDLSRRRLELWDVPEHQIKELEEKGILMKTLHIHSPVTGIVIDKPVTEGMYVKPGMTLYTIADLSRIWVYVDVYEYEVPWIKVGQEAEMTLASFPGEIFKGKVSFIYPYLEPKTRTVRVRLEFENPGLKLKPEMYANVILKSVISKHALAVPSEAIIRSGERNIIILDRGEGKFKPVEVTLGVEAGDYYEILDGLKEGDRVVTSAQFLIDSESRLKEAITKMLEPKKEGKEGKAMPMEHKYQGMDHSGMEKMKQDSMDHGGMEANEKKHGSMNRKNMEHTKPMDMTTRNHDM